MGVETQRTNAPDLADLPTTVIPAVETQILTVPESLDTAGAAEPINLIATDPSGHRYEIVFVAPRKDAPCSLSIREEGGESDWRVFQVDQHRGARHDALVLMLSEAVAEMQRPETFSAALQNVEAWAQTSLLSVSHSGAVGEPAFASLASARSRALGLLQAYDIPIHTWGQGQAKGVEFLLDEIERGESRLCVEAGQLCRRLDVVRLQVFYRNPEGELFYLREQKQVFADGRERQRNSPYSLGEKIIPNETSRQTAARGMLEELGIVGQSTFLDGRLSAHDGTCLDYPGIASRKVFTTFTVFITDEQFKPEGYVEDRNGVRTEFHWEKSTARQTK